MDIVTSSVRPLNVAGVNKVQVRGYDLQNNNLTLATTGATANNGNFSVSTSNIAYVPKDAYEFLFGSNPTNATSNLRITSFGPAALQWQAKGYEVYELRSSTDFLTWTRAVSPIVPTNANGTADFSSRASLRQFFRVLKVP